MTMGEFIIEEIAREERRKLRRDRIIVWTAIILMVAAVKYLYS